MARPSMVILEQDHERFVLILEKLRGAANAKLVFLLDKNGQQIACAGGFEALDPTSLASLTAGNVAATEGLAQLIGEGEFSSLFHEGRRDSLHISLVADKAILLVIFDERSSLGLVRLRVNQSTDELRGVLLEILARPSDGRSSGAFAATGLNEITDEDIEQLFG